MFISMEKYRCLDDFLIDPCPPVASISSGFSTSYRPQVEMLDSFFSHQNIYSNWKKSGRIPVEIYEILKIRTHIIWDDYSSYQFIKIAFINTIWWNQWPRMADISRLQNTEPKNGTFLICLTLTLSSLSRKVEKNPTMCLMILMPIVCGKTKKKHVVRPV